MHWFGVALWRTWYPSALACADVYVLAPSAFTAIETVMQAYQIARVAYAAADLVGGSLHYRAHKIRIVLDPAVVLEALSLLDVDGPACADARCSAARSHGCVLAGTSGERELVGSACYPCLVEVPVPCSP